MSVNVVDVAVNERGAGARGAVGAALAADAARARTQRATSGAAPRVRGFRGTPVALSATGFVAAVRAGAAADGALPLSSSLGVGGGGGGGPGDALSPRARQLIDSLACACGVGGGSTPLSAHSPACLQQRFAAARARLHDAGDAFVDSSRAAGASRGSALAGGHAEHAAALDARRLTWEAAADALASALSSARTGARAAAAADSWGAIASSSAGSSASASFASAVPRYAAAGDVPEVDIHGVSAAGAASAVESAVRRALAARWPAVRIVTGRGTHSRGGGDAPLRAAADAALRALHGAQLTAGRGGGAVVLGVVAGVERSPCGGAFLVRLRS